MNKRPIYTLLVLTILAGILSACTAQTTPEAVVEPASEQAAAEPAAEEAEEPAAPEELTNVTFANADQMMVTYYWLYLPQALGYWEEEGLDVEIIPTGGSVEALQQLAAGNADIAQMGAVNAIQASANEDIPVVGIFSNGVFQNKLGVLADSPITDVSQFSGKSIGVYSLASNSMPFLRTYLRENGVDPDTDVNFIATGYGAPAVEAIQNGDVDALYYWPSAFVSMETQGLELRYFLNPDWEQYPDYSVFTRSDVIEANPDVVEAFARGMARAMVFAEANPECTVRIFWEEYPDAKPTDMDEEAALQSDLAFLQEQMLENELAYELTGSEYWGTLEADGISALQDFMLQEEMLEGTVDPAALVAEPDFFQRANDFDPAVIEAQAASCPVD